MAPPLQAFASRRSRQRLIHSPEFGKDMTAADLWNEIDPVTGALFGPVADDDRRRAFASHDRKAVRYDRALHAERAIYFPGDYRDEYRILTHFYTYDMASLYCLSFFWALSRPLFGPI